MRLFAIAFLAAFLVAATQAKIETEDEVLVLTKDNIDEAVQLYDYMLVEFYAPWCGHCKALAPVYAKAAKLLQESGSPVKLAKVDATIETALAEEHKIRGYPTLKFYRKGSVIEYNGARQADKIVSWVTKMSGPAVKHLKTVEDAKAFIDANNVAVVGFFKDIESEDAKVFDKVGNAVDEHVFGITDNDEVFSEYETKDGKIVLFKKFDEEKNEYEGEFDVEKIKNFITMYSLPLVVDFNQDTARKLFSGLINSHLLVFLSKESGDFDKYADLIREPAKKFRDQVLFVTINSDDADHERILEFFGMKKEEVPAMRIIKLEQVMAKYKPEKPEITSENVLEFVTAFVEGKLQRHILSEDVPEDWDKNPVTILVGTNFHEVAHNKEKNVLVEFYAPWCGHCQRLAPIYEELGEKYKDRDDIVIAKMDATANELDDIKIRNYPTITLFKKETNEAVQYNGDRTLEGLTKFIESDGVYGRGADEDQEEDEDDDVPRKDEL